MTAAWERKLGSLIWDAKTSEDATKIINECKRRFHPKPIAVARENNSGTINMASDSGLALVERITNGIDSRIELACLGNPSLNLSSPEEAARRLFGVPVGGFSEMTHKERRDLATGLVVGMHESGKPRRPTVRVTDTGTGQHPSVFGNTLLSLNESNKVNLDYTMGTFGQGGSTTLGFSESVIFCSRRHPDYLDTGQPDRVGFTVAYEEDTDPDTSRWPRYVWLVQEDGSPLDLPVGAFPELKHGTRITHIAYDAQNLGGQFTTQMWQFLNNALFDPVLPFILEGDRNKNERRAGSRVILGNAARLSSVDQARGDIEMAAEDTHQIVLRDYGTVEASWWVLDRPPESTSRSAPADSYANANTAVLMTLHGQRQATKPRTWLKNTAKLPFLYKNMIVNINTNGLNGAGRRQVYASTRERARQTDLSKQIFDEVMGLIKNDDDLKLLNHLEREKRLAEASRAANDKVQKRLHQFIKTKLKDTYKSGKSGRGPGGSGQMGGRGTQPGEGLGKKKSRGGGGGRRNKDDHYFGNFPTSLTFDAKTLRVAQGFATTMWVHVNTKNGYLPENDQDLEIGISGASVPTPFVKSRSKLLGGKSLWKITAPVETPIGTYQLSATLMTPNGPLKESVPLEVRLPPEPNKTGKGGQEQDTGPEIRWVTKDQWEDPVAGETFTAKKVGIVSADDEATVLFVNRDFAPLAKSLERRRLTEDAITIRRDRYLYPVACGLWLQHHENQTMDEENRPSDEYLEKEMARLAEAVIVAIDPEVEIASAEAED